MKVFLIVQIIFFLDCLHKTNKVRDIKKIKQNCPQNKINDSIHLGLSQKLKSLQNITINFSVHLS